MIQMIQAALSACNEIRDKYLGLPPMDHMEKGVVNGAFCCPVARTINAGRNGLDTVGVTPTVIVLGIVGDDRNAKIDTPEPIAGFIRAFDKGQFPELIET